MNKRTNKKQYIFYPKEETQRLVVAQHLPLKSSIASFGKGRELIKGTKGIGGSVRYHLQYSSINLINKPKHADEEAHEEQKSNNLPLYEVLPS